ncbi:MAG TPA: FecR domain-containing protein [Polyangiaceae bacterium]|nr:FecR domain-containing protein [Polyangiaceae bacterium]
MIARGRLSHRALGALLSMLLLVLLGGCQRNQDELAKLEGKQGSVDRDEAAHQGSWGVADVGASFKVNDGVRTAAAAKAKLRLSDGSAVALQEKTLLRFLASPPGKKTHGLDVQQGEVELDVGSEGLQIETQAGSAVLEAGSRVRLRKTDQGTRFAVEIGAAHLTDAHQDVKAGESIEVGIGQAIIDRSPAPAPSDSAAPPPSAAPLVDSAAPSDGAAPAPSSEPPTADNRKPGPALADFLAAPGDSLIVHDPHPPTVVGFTTTRCPGVAVLEVGSKKRETIGSGQVTAAFAAGAQRYRLRCDGDAKPFAEGNVSVLADSGSRRLSLSAPVNRIDTDGRRYTILYQSLLPKVSVRWPNPPSSGPFTLGLSSQGRQKTFSSGGPSYALPPGTLGEGSHELWFEAHGERSRRTSVVVQFDNAAPTASISAPAERGFAPGATVLVSGMALPGWTVSAGGHELAQDSQQRFSGEVTAPAGLGALAIRFSHPQRGVHYYLRRSSR